MTMVGGEIDAVRALAARFRSWAGSLEGLHGEVAGGVDGAVGSIWLGRAAEDFRDRWHGEYGRALRSMVEALEVSAQELVGRADALEQADTRL